MSAYSPAINTCRFCKTDSTKTTLFKYGVRHYACAPCGFRLFPNNGRDFLDKLPTHQLGRIPFRAAEAAGWTLGQLAQYLAAREADHA